MSVEDLKAYGKRCSEDEDVRGKAKEIGAENIAGQAEYAKTLGFHFDAGDMEALFKEEGVGSSELSEGDLENVAGGWNLGGGWGFGGGRPPWLWKS